MVHWLPWLIPVLAILWILLQRSRAISPAQVRNLIEQGAMILDVRTNGEFASGHVPKAINVPLDALTTRIASIAPDRAKPLLLHCQSGMRSAAGVSRLKALGYTSVHNLGSLGRARSLTQSLPAK